MNSLNAFTTANEFILLWDISRRRNTNCIGKQNTALELEKNTCPILPNRYPLNLLWTKSGAVYAAFYVLSQNLVHGDALTMRTQGNLPITFAEWGYLGKGKFQRRDFCLRDLTMSSTYSAKGSLFADLGKHEIFTPSKTYPPMMVSELAATPEESTP